jgi:hypothetical protein
VCRHRPPPEFSTIDAPGAGNTHALGTTPQDINASGIITGYFTDANNTSHGFVRSAAGMITVFDAPGAGTLDSTGTNTQSINSTGVIGGSFVDQQFVTHGYI